MKQILNFISMLKEIKQFVLNMNTIVLMDILFLILRIMNVFNHLFLTLFYMIINILIIQMKIYLKL